MVEQEFDWADTQPSTAVSYALASIENERVEGLPPLYEYIDPESLDALVTGGENVSVSFLVREFVVEITGSTVAVKQG